MISTTVKRASGAAALLIVGVLPAEAHIGVGTTSSFAAGLAHPLAGLDHATAMVAVGLWAVLRGGRAIWAWPLAFVGVMLFGGVLGMLHVPVPLVEPGILASVVGLGLLVALAIELPVSVGVAIIGPFALLHGHAHGSEIPQNTGALEYMAGFAVATALLHCIGMAAALGLGPKLRSLVRVAGATCAALGVGLALGVV